MARRRAGAGYTVIEVLMAMTVMAIGGAAVMTMQKTSVTANLDARKTDVANSIARLWEERLQRDAMQWTMPNPENPGQNNMSKAAILNAGLGMMAGTTSATGAWFLPTQEMATAGTVETMSPAFDILGRDVPDLDNADFCVNVRLSYMVTNTTVGNQLVRADVRVIWPVGILNTLPKFCNDNTAALLDPNTDPGALRNPNADPNQPVFHAIYVTTTLRENTAP
jgi:type II secretory pathway pseudopilin PulG